MCYGHGDLKLRDIILGFGGGYGKNRRTFWRGILSFNRRDACNNDLL